MQQKTDGRVVRLLTKYVGAEGRPIEQWFLVAIGDDDKATAAVAKSANAADAVFEIVGHIPATTLASWGMTEGEVRLVGGMRAEYVVTSTRFCILLRKDVDLEQGAALLINPMTAWGLMDEARRGRHRAVVQRLIGHERLHSGLLELLKGRPWKVSNSSRERDYLGTTILPRRLTSASPRQDAIGRELRIAVTFFALPVEQEETMPEKQTFEIPQQMRELAQKNIEQARTAYGQLMDAMTQAMSAWISVPSEAMTSGFKAIQERAIQFAKENAEAGFALANDLTKARNVQDVLRLQSSFAQKQMESYGRQAQELGRLMMEATRSASPKS